MPYYVGLTRIDWHYGKANAELKALLPDADRSLSSSDHTAQTFEEELRKLAEERRDLVVDALVEDGFRGYALYRARDGKVSATHVVERPEGALTQEVSLPLDDMATVTLVRHRGEIRELLEAQSDYDGDDDDEITLPLRYDDEASMRELLSTVAKGIDEGEHSFVAEVDLDRFLVELRPGTSNVKKLVVVTEPDLVARLLRSEFDGVPPPPPRPGERHEQALFWPEDMLQAVKEEASRLDTSLSNVVQKAWHAARAKIAASEHDDLSPLLRGFSTDKAKQTLIFPGEILADMRDQATRIDSSLSFVVQSAWVLARDTIASLAPRSDD